MAKTNYTKAEEAFGAALERMKVEDLLEQADAASGKSKESLIKKRMPVVQSLKRELKRLQGVDRGIYKKLKVNKKTLEQVLSNVAYLNTTEWQQILDFKSQVDSLVKKLPVVGDAEIVDQERHKHINKRFNVSERWLPLT